MKWLFLAISVYAGSLVLQAQETIKLTLEFENLQQEGTLMVALFDSQVEWEKYKPIRAKMETIVQDSTELSFDVPKGEYGVAAFVDTNGNRLFDYGKEFYAFSNHYIPKEQPLFNHFAVKVDHDQVLKMELMK